MNLAPSNSMKDNNHLKKDKNFEKLLIPGAFELFSKIVSDTRGFFVNFFREDEDNFKEIWGNRNIKQSNLSNTSQKGTIRGLHYQEKPYDECKLIRCLKGKVWDVAVDLRVDSPTYLKWQAVELCPEKNNAIIIPEGCAHGFQSLEDNSELLYIHSKSWNPSYEKGVNWSDQKLKIDWPLELTVLSERDKSLPTLNIK